MPPDTQHDYFVLEGNRDWFGRAGFLVEQRHRQTGGSWYAGVEGDWWRNTAWVQTPFKTAKAARWFVSEFVGVAVQDVKR